MKSRRSFIFLTTAATTLFLICNCMTTRIADLEIQDMEAILKTGPGHTAASVIPGETYELTLTVTDIKGKTINRPSPADLVISSPDTTFTTIETSLFGMYVTGTVHTFVFTDVPGFSLIIKVKSNPYVQTFTWPVNWDEFTTLNFSGTPGNEGINGQDGRDGVPSYGVADGGDGSDGWDGEKGKNGQDVSLLVLYYSIEGMDIKGVTDKTMLFIADMTNKQEYLLNRNSIIIDASGGTGGKGGEGGDAGAGAEYSEYDTENTISRGKDGTPGNGGNGGDGGNGGNIHLLYVDDAILDYITVIIDGGKGGKAGEDGEAASFGTTHRGFTFDGKPGKDGQYTKEKITAEQAGAAYRFIENEYFDPGRIVLEL